MKAQEDDVADTVTSASGWFGGHTMNMATALTARALGLLDRQVVAESLCGTASAIDEFCGAAEEKRPLRASLEACGLSDPGPLNGWTLPDAVWTAICHRQPRLNLYPLGEIAERAVKKTVVALALQTPTHGIAKASPNLGEHAIERNLRRSMTTLGIEGPLKLFLSQYFFEVCIDYLRRSRDDPQLDYGFWYHFSRDGHLVSQATERKLRQRLADQCKEMAEAFLPFLRECLEEHDLARIEQRICDGLAQTFGMSPPVERRTESPDKPFVNVIVGSRLPPGAPSRFTVATKRWRRHLLLHVDSSNVSFSFDALQESLGHRIHSLVKDLLDIGAVVYMSDLYTKRQAHLGRRMGILMRVRHPEIWSAARLELERAVSFLGRDDFSIDFVKGDGSAHRPRGFPLKSDDRCVCLLSGGLDSAAGVVWALKRGLKPILVSHYASPMLAGIQKALADELKKSYGQQVQHVGVYVAKSRGRKPRYKLGQAPGSIMAQYLRSFLFLCLASAIALELGISRVYIFENGPVALNPLFSEARVNTRTAHPHFLAYFRALIQTVFGVDLAIENPFLYCTKGEVASILARSHLQGLIAMTNSCWNWFRVPVMAKERGVQGFRGRHDGECIPCVLRRTAVHQAGLWESDATYLTGIFDQFPTLPNRDTITRTADFLRFCQNVKTLHDAELLMRAPDFSMYAEAAEPKLLVKMYRRHSEEVIDCFGARSNDMFRWVFASALEE